MTEKSSYAQILKTSSIMGGAAGINLLLGIIRTKFAAVLIGTTGVGLLASFTAIQGIIGTIAGLGIQSSAVREVAAAVNKGDEQAIGRAVLTLRRVCWLTGLIGMLAMMAFSPMLSRLTFGNVEYTLDIAALGVLILLGNLSGGQIALIQGMRRIGDMALANVFGALLATLAAIGFYFWLGLRGIVPALVSVAALQLGLSWYFARRVPVPKVSLSWRQTLQEAGGMIRLGLVFMWGGLLGSAVSFATINMISSQEGIKAVGIYSAAFALSGVFVNFILGAMGADYYPRLAHHANDPARMRQLINEQTEIAVILALPGLLATLSLAPWVIRIFYSDEFLPAVALLQWFILGCLGRVVSWPMGFAYMAAGKNLWFFLLETFYQICHIGLIFIGLHFIGLEGAAIAFFLLYVFGVLFNYIALKKLNKFSWSKSSKNMILLSIITLAATLILSRNADQVIVLFFGIAFTMASAVIGFRELSKNANGYISIEKILGKFRIFNFIKINLDKNPKNIC